MAKAKYTVLIGLDIDKHRGEPGDVIDWVPTKVAHELVEAGVLEHHTKADEEAKVKAAEPEPKDEPEADADEPEAKGE